MKSPAPAFTRLLSIFPMTLITFHTLVARASAPAAAPRPPAQQAMHKRVSSVAFAAASEAPIRGLHAAGFAFVVHAGEPLIVLRNEIEAGMRKGAGTPLPGPEKSLLFGVDERRLPPGDRAWIGRAVRLFDGRGGVCEARVSTPAVWTRQGDAVSAVDEKGEPLPPLELDALVLRLRVTSGSCTGARFARDASLAPPAIYPANDQVAGALGRKAEAAIRKLAAYRDVQKRYVAEVTAPRASRWDAHEGTTTSLRTYAGLDGKPAFIAAAINAGAGCGEFGAVLSAGWEIKANGALVLRTPDAESSVFPHEPAALLDLHDGGGLAILGDTHLLRHDAKNGATAQTYEASFSGCGC